MRNETDKSSKIPWGGTKLVGQNEVPYARKTIHNERMPMDIAFIELKWDELHAELLGREVVVVEEIVVVDELIVVEELVVAGVVGVDDPVEAGLGVDVGIGDVVVVVPAVVIPPASVLGVEDGLDTDVDVPIADVGMALLSVIEKGGLALPESPIRTII